MIRPRDSHTSPRRIGPVTTERTGRPPARPSPARWERSGLPGTVGDA